MKISAPKAPISPIIVEILKDLPHGEVFCFNGSYRLKLKPTQYTFNSTLVYDILNMENCFVCDIKTGALFIMKGSTPLNNLPDATLLIKKGLTDHEQL